VNEAGLPDGIFSNQKMPIWVNFGGPWNGKVWHTYSLAIWNILLPFSKVYGHMVI
jgi:hypothetical protein